MAIKVAPKGEAARAALAGKMIGQAQATQRQIDYARQVQDQLRAIAAQKEMAEFRHQMALESAKFNASLGLEKEKRSKLWELEKMELRSRIDFQEEEKKRLKEKAEYEKGMELILENDALRDDPAGGPGTKQDARFKLQMHKEAGYVPSVQKEREEKEIDPIKAYIRQKLGGAGQVGASQQMQLGQTIDTATDADIRQTARGAVASITRGGATGTWGEDRPAQQNRVRVVSPDGRTGSISASEWPQYEAAGYRRI